MAQKKSSGKAKGKAKSSPAKKRTKKKKSPSWKSRIFKFSFLLLLIGTLGCFGLFGMVYLGLFGPLPSTDELSNLSRANASEVYSSDGMLLGKYFRVNRSDAQFEEIPKIVIDALVSTEDNRFFEHDGIDFYSIPRVVIRTVILGDRRGGGGSTISQQLIKNIYGRSDFGTLSIPVNKLKENITALKLEEVYSKEEIITLYLNTVSFGENVYGIKAASSRYFSKAPESLTVPEAATLVGMLKANTSYNPRLNPERSKERRNTVIELMEKEGVITSAEADAFQAEPLELKYKNVVGNGSIAPYLLSHLKREIEEIVESKLKPDGTPYNLDSDGLRIKLTVDGKAQVSGEKAVRNHMKKLQKLFFEHWEGREIWKKDSDFVWGEAKKSVRYKRLKSAGKSDAEIEKVFSTPQEISVFTYDGLKTTKMSPLDSIVYHQMILQASLVAMDPRTGEVKTYVGGVDFSQFPYDHCFSKRQVGSVFKPFVYLTALIDEYEPCDYIENEVTTYPEYDDWAPENSGGSYGGYFSLAGAMAKSVNTVAAHLIVDLGPNSVIATAKNAGIQSDIPSNPSIALGAVELSLFEMVRAYAPFANMGYRVQPYFIEEITDKHGEIIYQHEKAGLQRAFDSYQVDQLNRMLQLVADSGTARSLQTQYRVRTDIGGKTGTTQNNADGWFIGVTPNLVFGAWVGGELPAVRFRSTRLGQGAATALPIVGNWIHDLESAGQKSLFDASGRGFTNESDEIDCLIYRDDKPGLQLFENWRKKDKEKDREKDQSDNDEAEEEEGGWMKKLLKKLKKKKK